MQVLEQPVAKLPPELRRALTAVIQKLEADAAKRVEQRKVVEARWLEDLRDYHGKYDQSFLTRLQQSNTTSKVYMNRIRRKTRAMAARLKEMLFPTDDANWRLEPTPAPTLTREAEEAVRKVKEAEEAAAAQADEEGNAPPELQVAHEEAEAHADQVAQRLAEANSRCEAMSREIEDVLVESRYEFSARRVIDQACQLGAGIIKGPVKSGPRRRNWQKGEDNVYHLNMGGGDRPEFKFVDCWSFFPSTGARTLEESEGFFERHLLNKKEFRRYTRVVGFDPSAAKRVLSEKGQKTPPSYLSELRGITGDQISTTDFFCVWEYSGPLEVEEVQIIAEALGDEATAREAEEATLLDEMHVVIWFCEGELLKFGVYPLDSDEPLYSMFVLEPDEASVWGAGIPRLGRTSSDVINGGWRGMMDNAGVALGPIIVVDPEQIEPMDGSWEIRGPKIMRRKAASSTGAPAFEQFLPEMNQAQLANIIALGERYMDEETGLPQIAMGENPEQMTKTVGGMALLMSQAGVTFRETVRRFDDNFTVPNLTRVYDWLMQFSDSEAIKGDYDVKATGVSTLLLKELEAQNLMFVSQVYGPEDPDIKAREVKRGVFRALSLDPDQFMRTNAEREKYLAELQTGPSEADLKMQEMEVRREELEAKVQIANMETSAKLQAAEMSLRAAMVSLAEQRNMKLDELEARLDMERRKIDSAERRIATEVAMKQREDARAAAEGREPMGSGGLV